MSMVRCDECDHLIDSDDDPDCFGEFGGGEVTHCQWCREKLEADDEIDPQEHCSAMMLRDLHRIKQTVADPKMRAALLADFREYDHLLSRIQLELSVLEPQKFKVVSRG